MIFTCIGFNFTRTSKEKQRHTTMFDIYPRILLELQQIVVIRYMYMIIVNWCEMFDIYSEILPTDQVTAPDIHTKESYPNRDRSFSYDT